MPLNPADLVRSLRGVLKIPSDPSAASAQVSRRPGDWALAYNGYAGAAIAGAGTPQFTGSESTKFRSLLTPAFQSPGGPAVLANALASAVEAFWLAPPILFIVAGGSGVASAFPGKVELIPALISALTSPQQSELAAQRIGSALDSATRKVIVAITIPPAGPVPTPLS